MAAAQQGDEFAACDCEIESINDDATAIGPAQTADADRRSGLIDERAHRPAPPKFGCQARSRRSSSRATESASEFLSFIRSDRFKRIGTWTQTSVRNAVMIDVGAKVQACYLACAAMGLGTVCRITLDRGAAREALSLKPRQIVIASQSVGHTL